MTNVYWLDTGGGREKLKHCSLTFRKEEATCKTYKQMEYKVKIDFEADWIQPAHGKIQCRVLESMLINLRIDYR
jgi:hypothetical protein